jgi:hypothetical protein
MRTLFAMAGALMLPLAFSAALARADEQGGAAGRWISQDLPAGKIHEACMKLGRNDRLEYAFDAGGEVDFNIHYHSGNIVSFPVRLRAAKQDATVFEPGIARDYCLMWTNPGDRPVEIRYRFHVGRR